MMSLEREIWAVALAVEKQHGDQATEFIAERIRPLATADDLLGVKRWQAIAEKFNQLQAGTLIPPE